MSPRNVELEVRRLSGWETATFSQIDRLSIAAAPGDDGLLFTLIGERSGGPNQVERQILDIAERHRPLVDSEVPIDETTGEALPVALRE